MRAAISRLIEAARGLKLSVTEEDRGRKLAIGVSRDELTERLIELHDALEAADADGAADMDPRRTREAFNELFRWIRLQGLSIEEPAALVAATLGVEVKASASSGYDIMPSFSPRHERKKKGWKPTLTLPLERLRTMKSIGDHAKVANNMDQVVSKMGDAAPGARR